MERRAQKILYWIVLLLSLTPVVFFKPMLGAVQGAKAFYVQVLVEAALPFYIYLLLRNKNLRPDLNNFLNLSAIAFFLLSLISAIFGVNFSQSFWGISTRFTGVFGLAHFVLLFFYVQMASLAYPNFLDRLKKWIIWAAAVSSFYGLLVVLGFPRFVSEDFMPRVSGLFGNPIFFAGFLVIPMFLTIHEALWQESLKGKITYYAVAFLDLLAVYFTNTRGAFVAIFAAAALICIGYTLLTQKASISRNKYYILASIIIVFVLVGFGTGSKLNLGGNDSKARLINWEIAIKGFQQNPILGSGPENYYVYADKFFDSELYKYDPAWFDKPHNYLLEVLSTTGIFGLASYLAIFIGATWVIYKSYKSKKLELIDSLIFLGALLAFAVQDFFSFDTPATLLVFYLFLGMISSFSVDKTEIRNNNAKQRYAAWALGMAGLLSLYLVFAINIQQALAGIYTRDASKPSDVQSSKANLDKAISFNIPPSQLADIGALYLSLIQQSFEQKVDPKITESAIDTDIGLMEKITDSIKNNPRYWNSLANLYYVKASLLSQSNQDYSVYQQKSEDALSKALSLVPQRIEFILLSAKLKFLRKDYSGMDADLAKVYSEIPEDHLTAWYYDSIRNDTLSTLDFFIANFDALGDHKRVIALYSVEVKIDPGQVQFYAGLAAAYKDAGDIENARITAEKIIEINPQAKPEVENFLKTLK